MRQKHTNHTSYWLAHKGRVVDIHKKSTLIHKEVFVNEVDTKKPAFFITTQQGQELTVILGADTTISLYPPEHMFRGKVKACLKS